MGWPCADGGREAHVGGMSASRWRANGLHRWKCTGEPSTHEHNLLGRCTATHCMLTPHRIQVMDDVATADGAVRQVCDARLQGFDLTADPIVTVQTAEVVAQAECGEEQQVPLRPPSAAATWSPQHSRAGSSACCMVSGGDGPVPSGWPSPRALKRSKRRRRLSTCSSA